MFFIEMMLELVMDMEVEKVADKVADMEVDMEVDWHGGEDNPVIEMMLKVMMWAVDIEVDRWPNFQLIQVAPPGGQIQNLCMWRHLVAKFRTNTSGATWWLNFEKIQVAPPRGQISN